MFHFILLKYLGIFEKTINLTIKRENELTINDIYVNEVKKIVNLPL
jgi:hypothetical protein